MTIYIAHSSSFDFIKELYNPIKQSELVKDHKFVFPHEKPGVFINSKETIKNSDLVIAEVSFHSTSLGIELGWADMLKTPILLLHKYGEVPTRSLQVLKSEMFSYKDSNHLVKIISDYLSKL